MSEPSQTRLAEAVDRTWPPAEMADRDGWILRRGAGGGQRVSAASPAGPRGEVATAEAAMRGWGQAPLFRLMDGEGGLDAALDGRGYRVVDPVVFYLAPVAALADGRDETASVIRVSVPLALLDALWDDGGIGPARWAVMARAPAPKTALLARLGDRPAGAAFVGVDREVAMVHAIEVAPGHRRGGAGERLLRGAASFAAEHGAAWLALAVTEANAPARALYEKLGMAVAGRYHYRAHPG